MASSTRQIVEEYLTQYGWDYKTLSSDELASGWQGDEGLYPLHITIYDNWIGLQVRPFKSLSIDWDSWPEISRYLLEWNDGCHMVKLAIGPDGDVNISLDIILQGLSFEVFSDTLTVLGHYTEKLYDDLLSYFDSIGYSYCKSMDILT
ncbi:MAG: YbjN domain-containing protein [Oligoflexus sp.]